MMTCGLICVVRNVKVLYPVARWFFSVSMRLSQSLAVAKSRWGQGIQSSNQSHQ